MTLQDVKLLLIYTRKVFGVKEKIDAKPTKNYTLDDLRKQLRVNRHWEYILNSLVIFDLLLVTGAGIYAFMIKLDLLIWFTKWWYLIFALVIPLLVVIISLSFTKRKVKVIINSIPAENFDNVLRVLNEFRVFGGKPPK